MQLLYEGVDITDRIGISAAITTDGAGGIADGIRLTLFDAADWIRWGPKADDRIAIEDDGYRSGNMYIDTLDPDGDMYRLTAYSMPSAARNTKWASYEHVTLFELTSIIAGELGMGAALHGIGGGIFFPYLIRKNETALGFLRRILAFEGAVVKCFDGQLVVVGMLWAQEQPAIRALTLGTDMSGAKPMRLGTGGYNRCTMLYPGGRGTAVATQSSADGDLTLSDVPIFDNIQAGRWARGGLLQEIRGYDQLQWAMAFDPALTGLTRFDLHAPGDLSGEWIVEQVEHDHIERRSNCLFYRCVHGIV